MAKSDWITIVVIAAGLLALIVFSKLKVWHAAVVFGAGFYFATTPGGQYIVTQVTSLFATLGH